eukprot:Amastigsp_a847809_21.p3 type:complete len:131 gc:universal Amastigsp_a847809_21:103-495(+)
MSTLNRWALYTCGTRQASANVTQSPTQYRPAVLLSTCSSASNDAEIQCFAHSAFFSSPMYSSTRRFCSGCVSDAMIWTMARTSALAFGSVGNMDASGRVSSRYSRIAIDCVSVCPSMSRVGTSLDGFRAA